MVGIAAMLAFQATCGQQARADASQFSVTIAHVDSPPNIDGTLTDPIWQKASHVQLGWDFQFRRPAAEKTDAYIMSDDRSLYVAIVAEQSEPITATLHTNDVALAADDLVRVYLFPGGDHGFEYFFVATPIGTHNEFSSENSSFAPAWSSAGTRTPTGYIITMRIPLTVMRGDGRQTWRLQIERAVHLTGQDYEWAHDPSQSGVDNSLFVGYLTGMNAVTSSTHTKPRIGVYALGQIGSATAGGDTSHMGADLALPITPTSSFFSTLHPDYSNVDLDQQTISPTAFNRAINEVRPFFTQGANNYNSFNCNDCINYPILYTPHIPTPRDGYAVEGVQGMTQFAGFDSIGSFGRSDNAEGLTLQTQDKHQQLNVLQFGTNCQTPALVPRGLGPSCPVPSGGGPYDDNTLLYQITTGNRHNSSFYYTGGGEHGTFVSDPSQAHYREFGINLFTQTFGFFPAYHDVGQQYAPNDQFFQVNDVHGPSVFVRNTFTNAPTSPILNYQLSQDFQHYRNAAGQLDYADAFSQLTVNTKTQFQLQASTGYQYLLIGNYGSTINQNGALLSYGQNTSAPSTVSYNVGRFGPGYLRSTTRVTTLRMGPRGTLTLEGDNTNQTLDVTLKEVQWLERASVAYQLSSHSSIAFGVRRIIGTQPFLVPPDPTVQQTGLAPACPPGRNFNGCYVDAANVSFAFHRHVGQDELYVVYGDPNRLSTLPAFIVKFVHYFGAEKGT
jgi:hypothetical protein